VLHFSDSTCCWRFWAGGLRTQRGVAGMWLGCALCVHLQRRAPRLLPPSLGRCQCCYCWCCRVTPQGCQPVEGPTATKAWQALYACDEAGQARSLGISGEAMFGLALEAVQRAIQHLPGAHRCDCYCGWPEGLQPEAPVLVSAQQCPARKLQQQQRCASARRSAAQGPAAFAGELSLSSCALPHCSLSLLVAECGGAAGAAGL
jgi:hypothetical protein